VCVCVYTVCYFKFCVMYFIIIILRVLFYFQRCYRHLHMYFLFLVTCLSRSGSCSYWYKQYKATDVFNFSDAMFAGKLAVPKCWLFVAFNPLSAYCTLFIICINKKGSYYLFLGYCCCCCFKFVFVRCTFISLLLLYRTWYHNIYII
jgi:hypothetical protein